MSSTNQRDELPEGFKTWKEFSKAKKEKRRLKQEYLIKKLEKQKQKSLEAAAAPKDTPKKNKVCEELSTLSIAVPGSILDNAQSIELRTYLAGQIARAACVFKVDEIIVYDDVGIKDSATTKTIMSLSDSGEVCPARRCCAHLARILQYLECPQYLRKDFFPKHKDLEYAGLLNPLDAPHHMRQQDDGKYREGVVLAQPAKNGSYVNVGLLQHVKVNLPLQPGIRVTVEMLPTPPQSKHPLGKVVSPSQPLKETGVYWGYSVRLANSLNTVFTECPYKEGYDVTIGTSERGKPIETTSFPTHQHLLVVFGGLAGIEAALEADDVLMVDEASLLFDHYVNTCPDQGSRTIRTEEAILITLAELRTKLKPKVRSSVPQKEIDSTDILTEGSDDEHGSEEMEENPLKDSDEETKESTNMNTSKLCDQNSETQKAKKRNDNLIKTPPNLKLDQEILDTSLHTSPEPSYKSETLTESSKKKKRKNIVESDQTHVADTAENGQSKKSKKEKRKSKN